MVFPAGQTFRDLRGAAVLATDVEARIGLGGGADAGIRLPASGGVIASYKRRIAGCDASDPALAVMGGGGLVNFGQHG